ncbi:MAG: hypothetical protein EZS28_018853 [Streblomastix strix]|uniref:Uncharacterized protein n=1 Tax=Streblomastix strix TaxID=222440 RepID=A0A5J4VSQ2_9EUKA|nr:MAG: hypothetical protein EZS28_018853 [Streblomastix strix]
MVSINWNSEQNKGGDSCTENLSLGSNGGNITTSTQLRKGGKNNSQSGDMETNKGSGIHIKGVFQLYKREYSEKRFQKRLRICPFTGLREEEIAYTEKLEKELRENIIEETNSEQMNGSDQVRDLIGKGNLATALPNLLHTSTSSGPNQDKEII